MPNLEKAEIKKGTAHQIGALLDDQLEAAQKSIPRCSGGSEAAVLCAKKIRTLAQHVQGQVEAGAFDFDQAKEILKWLERAATICESESRSWNLLGEQAKGIVKGLELSVQTTKKVYDEEDRKAAMESNTSEDGAEARREARRATRAARKAPAKKAAKKKTTKKKAAKKKASKKATRKR
jgi:hypothetical protein